MGGDPAVRVTSVGKRFRILHRGPAGLKDRALAWVRGGNVEYEELWALREVSLEVRSGEMLGIIGANGSGKSTLLQVLAGIYEPDAGSVTVHGRLRALLELGTGFNPELSGRENVFLNGSLLGLARADIRSRFDQIVGFAEIERFIDMPLKTYSSGMQLRLAFATAAHFDPEVLVLDEVLAVGDDAYQRKCLARVREIREGGAAIVFISHDMTVVEQMCDRVAVLDQGRIVDRGKPVEVVGRYRAAQAAKTVGRASSRRWGTGEARFTSITLRVDGSPPAQAFKTGDRLTIRMEYEASRRVDQPIIGLAIRTEEGSLVTGPNTKMCGAAIEALEGRGALEYTVPRLPLLPGVYVLAVSIYDQQLLTAYDHWEGCLEFLVTSEGTRERFGVVSFEGRWGENGTLKDSGIRSQDADRHGRHA
jgi:ABC-type polysaccharide/polyol phosphate transport system ATPase subunit